MCGRFALTATPDKTAAFLGLAELEDFPARYNIAPTQPVPIVRVNRDGERELVEMRWGLVPRWAKDVSIGVKMINARAETLATNGAFRHAYAHHRCLVPANGFYEWRKTPTGKVPHHIGMSEGRPFALAGVYERWRAKDGEVVDSVAIVTTSASADVRELHDRMPVIVSEHDYGRWLDRGVEDVSDLLAPWRGDALRVYPVSKRVNAVANDDPSLCERVPEPKDRASESPARKRATPAPSDPGEPLPETLDLFRRD